MGNFVGSIPTPPRVLSEIEQSLLLKVTGEHIKGFRDHMLFSVALATGLREHEIAALNVGDIVNSKSGIRQRVELRVYKQSSQQVAPQEVMLPESLRLKLAKFMDWKRKRGESLEVDAPLFVSQKGGNLTTRQLRHLFRKWQKNANFENFYSFHTLRHTACTNVYRKTKDIRLTQKFARHKSLMSTERYAHPSVEDLIRAVQELPC